MGRTIIVAVAAALILAGISVLAVGGTSHNDAPLIAEDRYANNTDTYAFVSPANDKSVTLIANYIPMVEPGDGPTYSRFSDKVLYEIMVDIDGDAEEDLTYQFKFKNNIANGNTFLYNAGAIGVPDKPKDPSEPYENLNVQQYYTLTEVQGDHQTDLLKDARVAPANVGPRSTPDYDALADAAIHVIEFDDNVPKGKAFVGPRDEGFYIDLMAAFDLLGGFLDPKRKPADTFSGFNVYTIALEIPKARLQKAGDGNGIIGVWASASRPQVQILPGEGKPPGSKGPFRQVSRLGSPLVNELLMPLAQKDLFNASEPKDDEANGFPGFITDPRKTQGGAALIPLLHDLVDDCIPDNGRVDLQLALLTGIDAATARALAAKVPSLKPFADAGGTFDEDLGKARAEMLRLNYNVPPSAKPSPLGLLGGDPAGFPNGRRVGEDTGDIYLKAGAGAVLQVLGAIDCPVSLKLSDGVQKNDAEYLEEFPYLAPPHEGYRHEHDHGSRTALAMGLGSGLLFAGLTLGAIFTIRRRRNSPVA